MNSLNASSADAITLYITSKHVCSYLPDQNARTVFVDPQEELNAYTFEYFLRSGFRRSGNEVYRPHCDECRACRATRVPVRDFQPSRNHKRCWQRNNNNLHITPCIADFNAEHYELYQRYTAVRHLDGHMASLSPQEYLAFLNNSWCSTMFVEFRQDGNLIAVAVTDVLPNALSAVYTFFDPALAHKSLGVLAILWQIQEAKRRNLDYLYLGYWIKDCPKMRYKDQYRPLELWFNERWWRYEHGDALEGWATDASS